MKRISILGSTGSIGTQALDVARVSGFSVAGLAANRSISALERQDLEGVARRLYNVFEDVLPRKYAQVFEIKRALLEEGAMASSMTGSGPTVFGIFRDQATARRAAEALRPRCPATFFCKNVGRAV